MKTPKQIKASIDICKFVCKNCKDMGIKTKPKDTIKLLITLLKH